MKRIILPDEKLNFLADELAQKLYESRYFANNVIKGEELKTCTPYAQINKFLLFQLFQVLNQQMQRLSHPYFDFEEADVQGLMTQLQNQLSRHIKISQEDFRPLLKKAVYNNLKLVLDPIDTLGNFFFHNQDKVSLDTYEKYAPFFTDFDFAVNSILRYHQKNTMKVVEKDIFFVKLHRVVAIFNSSGEKDIETYRNEIFQRLTGRSIQDVVFETQRDAEEKRQAELRAEEEKAQIAAAEQRRLDEEDRRQREAEEALAAAEREAEEKRQREEAERQAAEAERLRQEAEEKRLRELSLFDTLSRPEAFFEISDEGESEVKIEDEVISVGTGEAIPMPEAFEDEIAENETVDNEKVNNETSTPEVPENRSVLFDLEDDDVDAGVVSLANDLSPQIEEKKDTSISVENNESEINKPEALETEVNVPEVSDGDTVVPVEEKNVSEDSEVEVEISNSEITPPKEEEKRQDAPVVEEKPLVSIFDQFFSKKPQVAKSDEEEEKVIMSSQLTDVTKEEPKNLVESLMSEAPPHLINTLHASQKIQLEDIPIHKQYLFVQRVFTGNNVRFRIIIDKANSANSREEIEEIVEKYILSNPDIRPKDPVVEEFLEILRSRFSMGR